jgi:hypothetical protein
VAAVDRIDLNPGPAQSANAETGAVAAEIATGAPSVGAAPTAAASAKAASMWVAVPVISTDTAEQALTVDAALAARGVNIASRDVQAVNATMVTDEDNGRALTSHQDLSV